MNDDYDLDDDDILQDGESLKVPMQFLDAVQRSVADNWDSANNRPGWRVPDRVSDAVEDAHSDYCSWLRGAHRTPSAPADEPKRKKLTLDAARADAEAAYQERSAWLRDAYKQGRP